jgi:hypothetical protein
MEKSVEEKRTRLFKVRFTPSEYEALLRVQRKTHLSMSHFIRVVLLEKAPKVLDKSTIASYKETLRLAGIISSNINQIAKAHNKLAQAAGEFSHRTQQVVRDTLEIMQLWEKKKKYLVQPPVANDAENTE